MTCLAPTAELLDADAAAVALARTELRLPASVLRRLAIALRKSEASVSSPPMDELLGGLAERSSGALASGPLLGKPAMTPAS